MTPAPTTLPPLRLSALGVALAAALLVVGAPPRLAAAGGVRFTETAWGRGPRIVDHALFDLDGDGRKDFLLVRGRRVTVHLQDERGRFHPNDPRQQRFNFVDKAILWTFADVTGDGHPEVLFLARDGVYYYRWRRNHLSFVPRTLLKTTSILTAASREEVRLKDFYLDIDGDGERDLLLPGEGAFLLHRGLGHRRFAPPMRLQLRPDVKVSTGSDRPTDIAKSSFWYAQPRTGDWNGDGLQDVFIYQRQQVTVFEQGAGGRFTPTPSLIMPLAFSGPLSEGRFKLDMELPTEFADVDGDGLTEIIATHMGRATTLLFRGRRGRRDLSRPDLLIRLHGITFLQFVTDLDGDGRNDLILARTDRPGLLDIVKVLITKEVSIELLFYYGREDGRFPSQPDERRTLDIPILFSSARRGLSVGTSAVLTILGDLDGDGRKDMLLRSGEDTLAMYRGEGRRFSEDEAFEITVHNMDGYRFIEPVTEDINGDGVADVVLTYYSWDGKTDRISLLLSSKG